MKLIQLIGIIGKIEGIFGKNDISFPHNEIAKPSNRSTKFKLLLSLVIAILLFGAINLHAQTTYYVRAGATGANSGSDWNNAYDQIPSSLVRGATYYIADGSYGNIKFDDPVSGTLVITIKKATSLDHGTATGWSNSYGDGQADLGSVVFVTNNYVIDGATRNENNWADGDSYGIRITEVISHALNYGNCSANIKLRYANIGGAYSLTFASGIPNAGIYFGGFGPTCNNWTISRCFIHNVRIVGQMAGVDNITWEYNWMGLNWSKEIVRGQNQATNVTFRYNVLKDGCRSDGCPDCEGCTAEIALFSNQGTSPNFNGFSAYGNVIWKTANIHNSDGCIFAEVTSGGAIYNNTIVNNGSSGSARLRLNSASGSEIRNNIWYLPGGMKSGCEAQTCDNNSLYTSSPPFVNVSAGNFRLSSPIGGVALGSAYKADMDGNTRGADGTWDRGAFEYGIGAGAAGDSIQPTPPTSLRIKTP
jgi:hypothetical protein